MNCTKCQSNITVKCGKDRKGKQVFKCSSCGFRFVEYFEAGRLTPALKDQILKCRAEGLSMRAVARILNIPNWETVRNFLKKAMPSPELNLSNTDRSC